MFWRRKQKLSERAEQVKQDTKVCNNDVDKIKQQTFKAADKAIVSSDRLDKLLKADGITLKVALIARGGHGAR